MSYSSMSRSMMPEQAKEMVAVPPTPCSHRSVFLGLLEQEEEEEEGEEDEEEEGGEEEGKRDSSSPC